MLFKLVLTAAVVGLAAAIPVDNGVEGAPEIDCSPGSITVNINTQNAFEGHVYVKGLYGTPGCRNDEGGRQVAGITLPFDSCGVSRQRSLNPRGVFVSTTVIISFHPLFLTKVDRAYRIQCFYMEADKTVDTELDVSMLTTEFRSQSVPMPICRYEILEGGPTGAVIEFAIVGQQVYHKWTCDTETVDTFCMIVHSCYVDDSNGDREDLIGADGCANDIYLLNNPEYPSDLTAGIEAHVFKYADRPQLYFQCQITILVKEPNRECPRPACAAPPGRGGPREGGPQPLQPADAFPLGPGSPYSEYASVQHGPGDPQTPFAAHPGRPDPATFHKSGAGGAARPGTASREENRRGGAASIDSQPGRQTRPDASQPTGRRLAAGTPAPAAPAARATPAPRAEAPSPVAAATPAPRAAAPSPVAAATPAPVAAAPSPVAATPAPRAAAPSPVAATPAPRAAAPSPVAVATPAPRAAAPSPVAAATPAPRAAALSPVAAATPAPVAAAPSPVAATPAPRAAAPSPVATDIPISPPGAFGAGNNQPDASSGSFGRRPFDFPFFSDPALRELLRRRARAKRQIEMMDHAIGTLDVRVGLNSWDIDDTFNAASTALTNRTPYTPVGVHPPYEQGVCISTAVFTAVITLSALLMISFITLTCYMLSRSTKKQ